MAKSLRLPPAASFARASSKHDHIIFNPPSSAPNVYHTPPKFLPASDPRRKLYSKAAAASANPPGTSPVARPSGRSVTSHPSPDPSAEADDAQTSGQAIEDGKLRLPPSLKPVQQKKYHLSAADVAEMQRLRQQDPRLWTRAKLADKFACSDFFVGIVAKNAQAGQARHKELERIKSRWGPRKVKARMDRVRRRESWGREL